MRYQREKIINKGLTKNSQYKKLSGVCAGIAKYYELPRLVVRAGAIAALILFPIAAGVAYVVASILLPSDIY